MNVKSNKINKLIIALFLVGLLATLFMLYQLPESVEKSSMAISPEAIKEASPVFIKTSIVTILTLILGFASILMSQRNSGRTEVVEKAFYVNEKDNKEEDKSSEDVKIDDQKIIDQIEQSIKNKKTQQTKFDAFLQTLCDKLEAGQGILYKTKVQGKKRLLEMASSYAYSLPEGETVTYEFGEGLVGQAAKEKKSMKVDEIPEGYLTIMSGLGSSSPKYLMIKPVTLKEEVAGVIELASFKSLSEVEENIIEKAVKLLETDLLHIQEDKKDGKKTIKKSGSNSGKE